MPINRKKLINRRRELSGSSMFGALRPRLTLSKPKKKKLKPAMKISCEIIEGRRADLIL